GVAAPRPQRPGAHLRPRHNSVLLDRQSGRSPRRGLHSTVRSDRSARLWAAPGLHARLSRAVVARRNPRRLHPGSRPAALTGGTHSGASGILISMSNTNPPEVFILIPGRTSRQGT